MPPKTKPIHTPEYRRMLALLRQAREQARLTQAAVGARIERPQSFVSKCESGERRIDPTELSMFAKLYRRSASYFLEEGAEPGTDTKRPGKGLPTPILPHGA